MICCVRVLLGVTIAFRLLGGLELDSILLAVRAIKEVTIAFRLLGGLELDAVFCHLLKEDLVSQSPFGFWGDWNNSGDKSMVENCLVTIAFRLLGGLEPVDRLFSPVPVEGSQSPFGFWGDWNHHISNVAPSTTRVTIAFRLLGGLERPIERWPHSIRYSSHNRLSAFGGIGTRVSRGEILGAAVVTIAFRLLG